MRRLLLVLTLAALLAWRFPADEAASAQELEIRFALIGSPRASNVWELFDEAGASYADYALRADFYPRLYHLAPPDFSFEPYAAQGLPAGVVQAGENFSAVVRLRSDLRWSDGSPFTAEDVAFTVNTALAFDLGFDWRAAYSREYLERVEAVNSQTAKFIFKKRPHAGIWQYGALQGAIVQEKFWRAKIAAAENLLPPPEAGAAVEQARERLAEVQRAVDELTAKLRAARDAGAGGRDIEIDLTQRKHELRYAKNVLNKALENYQIALTAAQQALYALDDSKEPTLGAWVFKSKTAAGWINQANPNYPFGKPRFARAVYRFFQDEKSALAAYKNGEADFVLSPTGLSRTAEGAYSVPTSSARFLVFNPAKAQFSDPALRAALSCMIDREKLATDVLVKQVAPLENFVVSPQWRSLEAASPCAKLNQSARIETAVKLLKDAGYSWEQVPTANSAGKKMIAPNGAAFPKTTLIAPSKAADALRYAAAKYAAAQAQYLGIPFAVKEMTLNEIVYAVYSSGQYDAALVGWRLGEYPAYLCEWFGGGNPRAYAGGEYSAACAALRGESDLEAARKALRSLDFELTSDLPFIPLFTTLRYESYQRLTYPAPTILNGWTALYGAPAYAMPAP